MKNKNIAVLLAAVITLTGCGGSSVNGTATAKHQQSQTQPQEKTTSVDYQATVQALYVAYFGRPADPGGLANFENALLAANAPTDIPVLARAEF